MPTNVPSLADFNKLLAADAANLQVDADQAAALAANLKKDAEQDAEDVTLRGLITQVGVVLNDFDGRLDDHDARLAALAGGVTPPASDPAPDLPAPPTDPVPLPPAPPPSTSSRPVTYYDPFRRRRPWAEPVMIRDPASLIAARLVLPIDKAMVLGDPREPDAVYLGTYLGMTDMGGTGERPELGIITKIIAEFMAYGGNLRSVCAWAESSGDIPIHYRHKNGVPSTDGTGEAANLLDDPRMKYASAYYGREAVGANPWFNMAGAPVRPNLAHFPNLCYVPYLLTGDLYYLQELQDAATYAIMWANPAYRHYEQCHLQDDETRQYAWGLNLIASAYLATREGEKAGPLPAPLLPSSYWKRIVESNAAEFKRRWVDNGDRNSLTGCHFAVDLTLDHVAPWQQDFVGCVLGWMIWTGAFPEWRGNYDWHINQAIDRASGLAGYPRTRAPVYYYKTAGVSNMASLASVNGLREVSGGHYAADVDKYYAAYLRANLKLAVMNGRADAVAPAAFADAESRRLDFVPIK